MDLGEEKAREIRRKTANWEFIKSLPPRNANVHDASRVEAVIRSVKPQAGDYHALHSPFLVSLVA